MSHQSCVRKATLAVEFNIQYFELFSLDCYNKSLRMPSMISFRFRPKFEGEAELSAMFNLHQYIFTSLANTPVKSFFRI